MKKLYKTNPFIVFFTKITREGKTRSLNYVVFSVMLICNIVALPFSAFAQTSISLPDSGTVYTSAGTLYSITIPNSYFVKPHSKVFRTIKGNKFLINNLIVINLF